MTLSIFYTGTIVTWSRFLTWTFALTVAFFWPSPVLFPSYPRELIEHGAMTKAAFQATRLTPSTFLVKEYNDIFSEHPHIYVKPFPSARTILVIDTGTGGKSNDPNVKVTSLRKFLETVDIADNKNRPLNEGGEMNYVVVTTHCHYDHILGVEDFKDSVVLASAHSRAFLSPAQLPEHSLCDTLHIRTPEYTPTLVPHGYVITSPTHPYTSLNITIFHTPGHTPDELALYDVDEMMLYVGDSLYEHEPIIFPNEGSIVTWLESMDYLMALVAEQNERLRTNQNPGSKEVLINSGHQTAARPAMEVLLAATTFVNDVIEGKESIKGKLTVRGEVNVVYEQAGGRFSLRCPEFLVKEARRKP